MEIKSDTSKLVAMYHLLQQYIILRVYYAGMHCGLLDQVWGWGGDNWRVSQAWARSTIINVTV